MVRAGSRTKLLQSIPKKIHLIWVGDESNSSDFCSTAKNNHRLSGVWFDFAYR